MARRKRRKKRSSQSYQREADYGEGWSLNPETKGAIFTIILFLVAIFGILSLFGLAGSFGEGLSNGLAFAFGWADWVFLLVILFLAFALLKSDRYKFKISGYIGLVLLFLAITGVMDFFVNEFRFSEITKEGTGGGALGYGLGLALEGFLGFWGSLVLYVAMFFIGVFLAFNTSFKDMMEKARTAGIIKEKILADEDLDEEEEEDEEEFEPDQEAIEEDEEEGDYEDEEEEESQEEEESEEPAPKKPRKKIVIPIDLLKSSTGKPDSGDISANQNKIKKTFDNFGIEVSMADVNVGPTVTQYTLRPAEGVRLSQMLTLQNDLALALAAHPLRMEAPIPGKSLVGIEVPNQSISTVKLRDIIDSSNYRKRSNNLHLALGKDVAGNAILADLSSMPHLLVAGATGSGKSVCINNIITSLMYQNSPDELKFILVDPKRVELSSYNDIPYLLTPVINDTDKTINALRWVVKEMHERYKLLQAAGKRNITSYNSAVIVNKMPHIVVIVDEFAALMSLASKEVEAAIVSLAQMARAVGIHLILATQRPSVDVITGLIKANIPARIAFAVASATDSKTILDTAGAEKLLGKGDMLFVTAESSKPKRIQGAYVTDEEINDVTDYVKEEAEPEYNDEVVEKQGAGSPAGFGGDGDMGDDLAMEAKEVVIKAGKASATLLQRRLRVGYARAARLLDILEEMGVVGAAEGSKAREVLISQEELEENFESDLDEEVIDEEDVDEEEDGYEDEEGEEDDDEEYEDDDEEDDEIRR